MDCFTGRPFSLQWGWLAAALCLIAPVAAAAEAPALTVRGCPDEAELRRLVAIELDALAAEARLGAVNGPTRAEIVCTGDLARVQVVRDRTDQVLELRLQRKQAPAETRARMLALAVTELVAASWVELDPKVPPDTKDANTDPQPAPTISSADRVTFDLLLSTTGQSMGSPRLGMLGGTIGARLWAHPRWGALLELELMGGGVGTGAGEVRARSASAAVSWQGRAVAGPLGLVGGVGARMGMANLEGRGGSEALMPRAFTGVWWGPFVATEASYPARSRLALRVRAELGHFVRGVLGRVDGQNEILSLRGHWLLVGAGVAFRL